MSNSTLADLANAATFVLHTARISANLCRGDKGTSGLAVHLEDSHALRTDQHGVMLIAAQGNHGTQKRTAGVGTWGGASASRSWADGSAHSCGSAEQAPLSRTAFQMQENDTRILQQLRPSHRHWPPRCLAGCAVHTRGGAGLHCWSCGSLCVKPACSRQQAANAAPDQRIVAQTQPHMKNRDSTFFAFL